MRPVVIAVAITGSVPRKRGNPAVPITVTEQIESTHEAFEVGAALCTFTSAAPTRALRPTPSSSRASGRAFGGSAPASERNVDRRWDRAPPEHGHRLGPGAWWRRDPHRPRGQYSCHPGSPCRQQCRAGRDRGRNLRAPRRAACRPARGENRAGLVDRAVTASSQSNPNAQSPGRMPHPGRCHLTSSRQQE
jgi:hypothetical protein